MDEHTFQSELKQYKVIRRADSHKVYWNKKAEQTGKLSTGHAASHSHSHHSKGKGKKASKAVKHEEKVSELEVEDSSVGFWEMIENSTKSILTPVELNKFLFQLRQVILYTYSMLQIYTFNYFNILLINATGPC